MRDAVVQRCTRRLSIRVRRGRLGSPKPLLTITGSAHNGGTLTVGFVGTADSKVYQWFRDGAVVAGQTATTYSVGAGDVGHTNTVSRRLHQRRRLQRIHLLQRPRGVIMTDTIFSVQDDSGTVAQITLAPSPSPALPFAIEVGDTGRYEGIPDNGVSTETFQSVEFAVVQTLDDSPNQFSVTAANANMSDWPANGQITWLTGANAAEVSQVTRIDGANSYSSVEEFLRYLAARGLSVPQTATTAQMRAALVQATDYLDQRYRYAGIKLLQTMGNNASVLNNSMIYSTWLYPYNLSSALYLTPSTSKQSTMWPRQGVDRQQRQHGQRHPGGDPRCVLPARASRARGNRSPARLRPDARRPRRPRAWHHQEDRAAGNQYPIRHAARRQFLRIVPADRPHAQTGRAPVRWRRPGSGALRPALSASCSYTLGTVIWPRNSTIWTRGIRQTNSSSFSEWMQCCAGPERPRKTGPVASPLLRTDRVKKSTALSNPTDRNVIMSALNEEVQALPRMTSLTCSL
jgi:hypothetical protein